MNRDRLEGKWKQFKGILREKWGKLTHDDFDGGFRRADGWGDGELCGRDDDRTARVACERSDVHRRRDCPDNGGESERGRADGGNKQQLGD